MRTLRAGTDKIHFTAQDIPELRYLINANLANNAADSGNSFIRFVCPYWSGLLSIKFHRAKLGKNEGASVFADTFLLVKNRSTRIDFNQNRRQHHERQRKKHPHQSYQSVYGVANNPTQPGLATSPGEDQPRRAH